MARYDNIKVIEKSILFLFIDRNFGLKGNIFTCFKLSIYVKLLHKDILLNLSLVSITYYKI